MFYCLFGSNSRVRYSRYVRISCLYFVRRGHCWWGGNKTAGSSYPIRHSTHPTIAFVPFSTFWLACCISERGIDSPLRAEEPFGRFGSGNLKPKRKFFPTTNSKSCGKKATKLAVTLWVCAWVVYNPLRFNRGWLPTTWIQTRRKLLQCLNDPQ